jgi:hypothetical protein
MTSLQLAVSGRLPEPDLIAVLIRAGFASNLARWVDSQLEAGPYTLYTVRQQQRGSQTVLSIDTFLLDPWVNSKTGETGESPHGSCEEYVLDADGNVVNDGEAIDADGTETQWISRSVSFYGG